MNKQEVLCKVRDLKKAITPPKKKERKKKDDEQLELFDLWPIHSLIAIKRFLNF